MLELVLALQITQIDLKIHCFFQIFPSLEIIWNVCEKFHNSLSTRYLFRLFI